MKIAGLQKVSLIDYPDRVAATVFIAGCNLDCGFCHNRWMLDEGDVDAITSPSDLLGWLRGRAGKLDGVCITGGEPLLATELPEFVLAIKSLGMAVKLDTNGCCPERLQALLEQGSLDYVAMDIKAPLDDRYAQTVGVEIDLGRLRQSMQLLRTGGVAWEFRTTVHPDLDADALLAIAWDLEPSDNWVLQPYAAAEGVLPEVRERAFLAGSDLRALLPVLRAVIPGVTLRTG